MFGKVIGTGLIVTSLLCLGGCGIPAAPLDLIKPPQSEEKLQQDAFHAALQHLLPDGARLVVPVHGQKSSGVSFGDVDGDGLKEAVVVYEENILSEKILKAALLKRENESWHIIWDTKGFGYGLDYAGIEDVNKDGLLEIILGWSLGAGGNGLNIYEWRNNEPKLWVKKGYHGHFDATMIP